MGVRELAELRYVLYETKGDLTVVRETGADTDSALVRAGLVDAATAVPDARAPTSR
jgi:hypothetical protein